MSRHATQRLVAALSVAALSSALSCRSGDSTGPEQLAKLSALPAGSQPSLSVALPPGNAMTSGTTDQVGLTVANVSPGSCTVSGPGWLGLAAGLDANVSWSVTPTASGVAPLLVTCAGARHTSVSATDTLVVYPKPAVIPDISGTVPVAVGDSIDVSYDSTSTPRIDVACGNCGAFAGMRRTGPNTLRVTALAVPPDTAQRGVCFTVHGLDGRYAAQQCVTVAIMPRQAALYSVPAAIRAAELVSLHTIPVATYDGTGQSTHPDFMRVGAPWAAGACYLAFTPYYQSNGFLENPSLATSSDCEHWTAAVGVPAPLVAKPDGGYNSDPDLIYDANNGCLGVVFRQVITRNIVNLTRTCDGRTFSAPRQLFTAPNHSAVSPTVSTGHDGNTRIWYVDAGMVGCTNQSNVVKVRVAAPGWASLDSMQFAAESPTDLVQPGYVIWHIKVRYVAALGKYVAMYAAFPRTTGIGNCTNDDLFIATSADGTHWQTFQAPVLDHLDRRFNFTTLYRASFQYDPATDQLRTIVSGLENGNWGQYGVVHAFTPLVKALNTSWTVSAAQLVPAPNLVRKAGPRAARAIIEDQP